MAIIRIPVRVEYDGETDDWHYHARIADTIGVVGGGQASREDARKAAAESIAVALEAGNADHDEVEYLEVAIG